MLENLSKLQAFIVLNLNLATKKYLIRLGIFLLLYFFIVVFHPQILKYFLNIGLVANDPFLLFILLPILIIFSVWRWPQIKLLPNYRQRKLQTIFFLFLAVSCYLLPFDRLYQYFKIDMVAVYYLFLYLGHSFLFLAVFNWRFVKFFYDDFLIFLSVIIMFIILEVLVTSYWKYFSWIILGGIKSLVGIIPELKVDIQTLNITLKNFSVYVGSSCAGIYSLFAFSLLMAVSVYFLKQKFVLIWWRVFLAWLSGLVLVLVFNTIRIIVIILVGAYYSKDLAINLFHEYLGGVFLLGIFYLYLHSALPFLIRRK